MDEKELTVWQTMKLSQNPEKIRLNLLEKILAVFLILTVSFLMIVEDGFRIIVLVIILEILFVRVLFTMQNRSGSNVYLWIHAANVILCTLYMYYIFGNLLNCLALILAVYGLASKPLVSWFKIRF
jgi:uncharacterized membrane protein